MIPAIAISSGTELDRIGAMYKIERFEGEPCEDYRERLLHYLTNSTYDSYYSSEEIPEDPIIKKIICECGAHKLGFTEKGPGHSSWCPMALDVIYRHKQEN